MTFGPNPIAAESARKALVENDGSAAFESTENASRAELDAQELRELERTQYYGAVAAPARSSAPVPATPTARRTLIARLFRRG